MFWVILFCAIALAGLIMVACYAVWLAHKTSDFLSEVTVLGERAGQMVDLLATIEVPSGASRSQSTVAAAGDEIHRNGTGRSDVERSDGDVR